MSRYADGPWYGRFRDRLRFERGARVRFPGLVSRRRISGAGWEYRLSVTPPGSTPRQLLLEFPLRHARTPVVTTDGPQDSPHRYEDGSLCIWHPRDPRELRWSFDDGLVALIGHAMVHLAKEELWRAWGEWPGDEAPHGEYVPPLAA